MAPKDTGKDEDVKGLERSAWCARVGAHVAEVQSQINKLRKTKPSPADEKVLDKADQQLIAARRVVDHPVRQRKGWWRRLTKADAVAALANVHEAEVEVLRLLQREELKSQVPRILTHAKSHLPSDDPGLERLEEEWQQARGKLPEETKYLAAATLHAANEAEDEQRARLHSFVQILICSIMIMLLIAVALAVWASLDYDVARIFCFQDEEITNLKNCPTGHTPEGSDIFLIEFTGMFAAALAGAVSLRSMRGTSGPYHVSVLLLLLRLPVGAMTAVLGVLLISGEFFPGLTRLDTGAQIVAWAAAFGVLQETVTRTVDEQGRAILSGKSEEVAETSPVSPDSPNGAPDESQDKAGNQPPRRRWRKR